MEQHRCSPSAQLNIKLVEGVLIVQQHEALLSARQPKQPGPSHVVSRKPTKHHCHFQPSELFSRTFGIFAPFSVSIAFTPNAPRGEYRSFREAFAGKALLTKKKAGKKY